MGLRCLLFSSDEGMVQPIWQALTELGIEGEYCGSAVDAVERVTTQLFQIVITDWEDQPEAAFLLKTARDLKAAQRPLTLAIVRDEAKPEALQAGANSVLSKPMRAEQVLDTLRTACELLRAKMQPSKAQASAKSGTPQQAATAKAVSARAVDAAPVPSFVTQAPEKAFRAGEFLQSSGSKPGAQFDTESEVKKDLEEVPQGEVEALTDLEPTAASVNEANDAEVSAPAKPQESLTGWAALQARLAKTPSAPAKSASPARELLSYGDTPSYGGASAGAAVAPARESLSEKHSTKDRPTNAQSNPDFSNFSSVGLAKPEAHKQPQAEVARADEPEAEPEAGVSVRSVSGRFGIYALSVFATVCLVTAATPRGRKDFTKLYQTSARLVANWLNPPNHLPQTIVEHESFRQAGDEYKLPTGGNLPDISTDASQIRVVPVVDPTVKADKTTTANSAQSSSNSSNNVADPNGNGQNSTTAEPAANSEADKTAVQNEPISPPVVPVASSPGPPLAASKVGSEPVAAPLVSVPAPAIHSYPPSAVPAASNPSIPSSLKSQIASMTPEASGTKPEGAAMSSIEPVNLPESTVRTLLAQSVEPEYPAAAKVSGQRGSVVLQILIGRDGTVQDAKFLEGSLIFARAAIDAVKQWRFKPYSMNGRPVSVSSAITLNFNPPA